MSLKERLAAAVASNTDGDLVARFGVDSNPYPSSSQTTDNPHYPLPTDELIDTRIESFVRDKRSQVIVVVGTQGVGKTNVLNFYEKTLKDALGAIAGYYVVRYLADPEATFDGTLRRLFQELGTEYLQKLGAALAEDRTDAIDLARSHEVKVALYSLAKSRGDPDIASNLNEWLLGLRLLKMHRDSLGVNFRLDTVESKTAALRDLVQISSRLNLLNGIFLLLDELEKQDGVLSATSVVRYLSSMRAIIDALPSHLFMMIAVTPDALRRYSVALPAFRSRLEDRVELHPLGTLEEATALANFYLNEARRKANGGNGIESANVPPLVSPAQITEVFANQLARATRRGDSGVRQREFLHELHTLAEKAIQSQGARDGVRGF